MPRGLRGGCCQGRGMSNSCRNSQVVTVHQKHPETEWLKANTPVCRIMPSKRFVTTAEIPTQILGSLTSDALAHTFFQRYSDISPALLQTALNDLPKVKGVKKPHGTDVCT